MSGLPNLRRRTWRPRRQSDTFDGPDPDGYALEVNVNRRHMSKGARAMAVAFARPEATKLKRAGSGSSKIEDLASGLVSMARLVLRVTPTVAQSVIAGEKPLAAAYEEAKVIEAERVEPPANQYLASIK
jgi:hypothetical protein